MKIAQGFPASCRIKSHVNTKRTERSRSLRDHFGRGEYNKKIRLGQYPKF